MFEGQMPFKTVRLMLRAEKYLDEVAGAADVYVSCVMDGNTL